MAESLHWMSLCAAWRHLFGTTVTGGILTPGCYAKNDPEIHRRILRVRRSTDVQADQRHPSIIQACLYASGTSSTSLPQTIHLPPPQTWYRCLAKSRPDRILWRCSMPADSAQFFTAQHTSLWMMQSFGTTRTFQLHRTPPSGDGTRPSSRRMMAGLGCCWTETFAPMW